MSSGEQSRTSEKPEKGVTSGEVKNIKSTSKVVADKRTDGQSRQSDQDHDNSELELEPSVSTPKTGIKRVLTPSPVIKYQFLKKSRQLSGALDDDRSVEEMIITEGATGELPEYVSVPLPLDTQDIAYEIIKDLIQKQTPDINSIVHNAVDSAVGRINETLMKEFKALQKNNEV